MISSVVEKHQEVLCWGIFNTEYTDGTKPEGDTEFLKEHGNPQKLTPFFNSKFKVHNSKLWLGRVDEYTNGQVNKLLILLVKVPQSRDRRPRLSAHLPRLVNKQTSVYRTDEGICPYWFVSFPSKEGVPLYQREAFFVSKRGFLHGKETPPL